MKPNAKVGEESSNIIGYSLNKNEKRQFVDVSTGSVNDKGETTENTEDIYVASIISEQAEVVELEEGTAETEETAVISKNVASAALSEKTSGYGIRSEIWNSSYTVMYGKVAMQWELWQETADGVANYDHFTLRPVTQATAQNGARAWYLWQDIDIPSDNDELRVWTPKGDTKTDYFKASLSFPWSVTVEMNFDDAITIDDQSDIDLDFGRWDLRNHNLSGEAFTGSIGWKSYGTWAYVTYAGKVGIYFGPNQQYVAYTPNKRVTVSYNY